tara:strand:+ start:991 stop:1290 length:300 start_codon:yes stop_codon:yes gene_type:complete
MYKFTKKISCDDPAKCSIDIMTKLETKFGFKIHGKNPEGHISIQHDNSNDHILWIFLYSQAGVHESADGITEHIVETKSNIVKKFKGTFPTQKEIKNAI